MKLLFDQNLSPYLADRLADLFPGSSHVLSMNLDAAEDDAVWTRAHDDGFVIVSKDGDFNDMVLLRGFPPKVVWLQLGNCTTHQVESAFRAHRAEIEAFESDPNSGTFVLR